MKENSLKFFVKFWLPPVSYAGLIFYLSSIPRAPLPSIPYLDKLLHLAEYSILGFLIIRALSVSFSSVELRRLYVLTLLFCLVYGLSDEFHQFFVPGRQMSVWDVYADGLGGFVGALFKR